MVYYISSRWRNLSVVTVSFGVSADVPKATLLRERARVIYIVYRKPPARAWLFVVLTRSGQATCPSSPEILGQ